MGSPPNRLSSKVITYKDWLKYDLQSGGFEDELEMLEYYSSHPKENQRSLHEWYVQDVKEPTQEWIHSITDETIPAIEDFVRELVKIGSQNDSELLQMVKQAQFSLTKLAFRLPIDFAAYAADLVMLVAEVKILKTQLAYDTDLQKQLAAKVELFFSYIQRLSGSETERQDAMARLSGLASSIQESVYDHFSQKWEKAEANDNEAEFIVDLIATCILVFQGPRIGSIIATEARKGVKFVVSSELPKKLASQLEGLAKKSTEYVQNNGFEKVNALLKSRKVKTQKRKHRPKEIEKRNSSGKSKEETAESLSQMHSGIGLKYKNAPPEELKDFLYGRNIKDSAAHIKWDDSLKSVYKQLKLTRPELRRRAKELGISSELLRTRRQMAIDFYNQMPGFRDEPRRIVGHLQGIDFYAPVEISKIKKGTLLYQWQIPGGSKGNYFSEIFQAPQKLGIANTGIDETGQIFSKVVHKYMVTEDTLVLKTTSNSIMDSWSHGDLIRHSHLPKFGDYDIKGSFIERGHFAAGGGRQILLNKRLVNLIEE
jgi:hypothetical protein